MKTNLVFWKFFKQSIWLKGLFALSFSGLCLLIACKDDTISPDVPIVVVGEVTDINTEGATFHGQIINEGRGFNEVGFVWDESASPAYASSRKVVPAEKGIRHFSARISADHQSGKGYTVKAYLKTGDKFTFSNAVKFTSKGSLPPVIDDFSPKSGLRNTEVTIYGKNFSNVASHISVKIGEITVPVTACNDSIITVKIPQNVYTSGTVKITVSVLGKSTTSIDNFDFGGVVIDHFSPKSTSCYSRITIYGKNFEIEDYTYVYFRLKSDIYNSGSYGEILQLSDAEIEVKVPELSYGAEYFIEVQVGQYRVTALELFSLSKPVISDVSPLSVFPYDTLVITGKYFTVNNSSVFLGNEYLPIITQTDTIIKVIAPIIVPGTYSVEVRTGCDYRVTYAKTVEVLSQWKSLTNIPIPARLNPICLTIGDKIFIGLGMEQGTDICLRDLWEYNTITNYWTRMPDFPDVGRSYVAAVVHQNKIFIGGGIAPYGGGGTDNFWLFDPVTKSWNKGNYGPCSWRRQTIAFSLNDRLYSGLGCTGYQFHTDFYEYIQPDSSWVGETNYLGELAPMGTSTFTLNSTGYYVFTKYYGYTSRLYEFNMISKWQDLGDLGMTVFGSYHDYDDLVFYHQPLTTTESPLSIIDTNTWTIRKSLPLTPYYWDHSTFFGAIVNDRLYIGFGQGININILYLDLNDYK